MLLWDKWSGKDCRFFKKTVIEVSIYTDTNGGSLLPGKECYPVLIKAGPSHSPAPKQMSFLRLLK